MKKNFCEEVSMKGYFNLKEIIDRSNPISFLWRSDSDQIKTLLKTWIFELEWTFIKRKWFVIPESEKNVVQWGIVESAPKIVEVIKEVPVEKIVEVPVEKIVEVIKEVPSKSFDKQIIKDYDDSLQEYKQKLFDVRQELWAANSERAKAVTELKELKENFDTKVWYIIEDNDKLKKQIEELESWKEATAKYITKLLATIQRFETKTGKQADPKEVKTIMEQMSTQD